MSTKYLYVMNFVKRLGGLGYMEHYKHLFSLEDNFFKTIVLEAQEAHPNVYHLPLSVFHCVLACCSQSVILMLGQINLIHACHFPFQLLQQILI